MLLLPHFSPINSILVHLTRIWLDSELHFTPSLVALKLYVKADADPRRSGRRRERRTPTRRVPSMLTAMKAQPQFALIRAIRVNSSVLKCQRTNQPIPAGTDLAFTRQMHGILNVKSVNTCFHQPLGLPTRTCLAESF
jgi:hypothetical protein